MPSPSPGMDPYLERHWPDVHTALISEARRSLNYLLPKGLVARVEERVAIESDEGSSRRAGPDVRVFSPSTADPAEASSGIVIDAPYKLVVELDPVIERYIRVVDESGQLITVLEFISPTNKRQPGLEDFREKRAALLAGGVHGVEVDLVRAGNWRALMRPEVCPPEAVSPYRAVVRKAARRPEGYLFPIHLRDKLPDIPVPLRPGEKPVYLPLQQLLNEVYSGGRYDETIDYSQPLEPPLDEEETAWSDHLLRESGRR